MEDIVRTGEWEYLGTVAQNGVQFIALRPLEGDGQVGFFRCEAGQYRRVADAVTERTVARRFRQAAAQEAVAGFLKAR